jgi:hypothetical protein
MREPGKGAIMLTDQLLETIQAERDRQIKAADRMRLLTQSSPDEVEAAVLENERVAAAERRLVGRQPRPATDSPR